MRPDALLAPLLLHCIRAKYLSSAQIPHGVGAMARNRDKPTKIPSGTGSSELIGRQQSITPTNQSLLSGLPEHLFTSLFGRATTVRLKTNEALFFAGDTGDGCYRVEDGLLKVTMVSRAFLPFLARARSWVRCRSSMDCHVQPQ